jgi:NAD(P)-dependent dehydrogenase (short-subunit alcohol dehydrogenase family)
MGKSGKKTGKWIEERVPDLDGKLVIVTGANSGIGFEAAIILATKGARVVMACRNLEKSEVAFEKVKSVSKRGEVELIKLDLADFYSIRIFADKVRSKFGLIDILVNNAGVMATPYGKTGDGFEMQFGTNHLGHFLLTGLLLDRINPLKGSRVVTISSIAHFNGHIKFDDINSEKSYNRMKAYRQSKLANLLFTYELQRRLVEAGSKIISVSVHPGISATSIVDLPPVLEWLKDAVLMDPIKGALPTIMGATDPSLKGGEFIGPSGFRQAFGFPAQLKSSELSMDLELGKRLWELSEEMTGIEYEFNLIHK